MSDAATEPEWHKRGGCAWRWRENAEDVGIYQCAWCGQTMVGGKRGVRVVLEADPGVSVTQGTTVIA